MKGAKTGPKKLGGGGGGLKNLFNEGKNAGGGGLGPQKKSKK